MENPSEKRKNDVSNQTNDEIIIKPPQPPSWAEEDTTENKRRFMFRGTDMTQVPCFKQTFMNGIGSMMVVGVGYNLATSKNPMKISMITYCTVVLSSWVYCRINRARSEFEMSKLQSAMNSYHLYEGTQKGRELDEAWLKKTQEEHEKKDPSYK